MDGQRLTEDSRVEGDNQEGTHSRVHKGESLSIYLLAVIGERDRQGRGDNDYAGDSHLLAAGGSINKRPGELN